MEGVGADFCWFLLHPIQEIPQFVLSQNAYIFQSNIDFSGSLGKE
jgi:hypothetical protein